MVNTLKKIVLGALLAATVTLAVGAVDTFAADRYEKLREAIAEGNKGNVEEAREAMIDNYKADLNAKIAEEKAVREAIRNEAEYKYWLQDSIADEVKFTELYVRAVADQSRGLDVKAIKEAQAFAQLYLAYDKWYYDLYNSYKTWEEYEEAMAAMTDEQREALEKTMPKMDPNLQTNFEAFKKAMIAVHPEAADYFED